MKRSMKYIKQLTLLISLLAGFSACQPKKDAVRAVVNPFNNINGFVANQCAQGVSNIGAIYDNTGMSVGGTFQDRVKALLSATMYPEDVGTIGSGISETTGVRFVGTMFLDAAGTVVSAKSKMLISVYDSIWYNNSITNPSEQAIPLEFDPTKGATLSGQFTPATGQGYFLLKDQYGEIRFDGTFDTQTFSGTVSFRNITNVTGGAAASGTLGQFLINSCGIVQK